MRLQGISFRATPKERELISLAVSRLNKLVKAGAGLKSDWQGWWLETSMDLTAVHCNGCPLDLQKLVESSNTDFLHDVFGIRQHIDRDTGKLTDCFFPRCAVHPAAKAKPRKKFKA